MTLYRYTGALNASRDGQPRCGASTDEGWETLNPSRAFPYRYGKAPDAYGKAVNPYGKAMDLYGEALGLFETGRSDPGRKGDVA